MHRFMIAGLALSALLMAGCPSQPAGAPEASFTLDKRFGTKPHTVQFTDTSLPGDAPITAWVWDFGDEESSTEQNPSHTYDTNGTYNVKLTVTNSIGKSSTESTEAVVVGQTWAASDGFAGDDSAVSLATNTNGDLLVLSTVKRDGRTDTDIQLQRRSAAGKVLWTQYYGGTKDEIAGAVIADNGEILICGSTRSSGQGGWDAYVARLNTVGEILWSETYGTVFDEKAEDIKEAGSAFVVAGQTSSGGAFPNFYLFKIDAEGEQAWAKSYGTTTYTEIAHNVTVLSDGGFLLVGEQTNSNADMYVVRADKDGKEVWKGNYGGFSPDRAYRGFASGSDFIVLGLGYSETVTGNDVMMLKLDKDGKKTATYYIGGVGREEGFAAVQLGSNFVIAGSTTTATAGGKDVYLVSVKPNGEKVWSRTIGGAGDETARALALVSGDLVLAGETNSWGMGGKDAYILRTNNLGLGPTVPDGDL